MQLTLLLEHIDTTEETTTSCEILVVEIDVQRQNRGMGIVGMKYHELLLSLGRRV